MSSEFAALKAIQRKYFLSNLDMCDVLGGFSISSYANLAGRTPGRPVRCAVALLGFIDQTGTMLELIERRLGAKRRAEISERMRNGN